MSVTIEKCVSPAELYRQYDGEHKAQPVYIELDLRCETLLASYDAVVGNATPIAVRHGFERRYGIPALTGEAANRLMERLAPFANRILADWEKRWDGNNFVARLGKSALAAEEEMRALIESETANAAEEVMVAEWDIDGAVNGHEVDMFEITGETTDERLDEIEAEILTGLAECSGASVAVCNGLGSYLRDRRNELRNEDAD